MQTVNTPNYNIIIGSECFEVLNGLLLKQYSSVFVLVDENTDQYCLPILKQHLQTSIPITIISIQSGEVNKNIETCQLVWKKLIENKADRGSLLINLGGGVICDMGGFVASTFKRGIDFVNIPTTLLSQVDASIGGKTGINFQLLKNQIGTFSNPKFIFINPVFFKTLPQREWLCGYAEMLKHALIDSKEYWDALSQWKGGKIEQSSQLENLILTSIQIKQKIIEQDPYENGLRKVLNFGHTIGHAIESLSLEKDNQPLTHGEAIAIGMICESYISTQITGLSQSVLEDITQFILSIYPPYNLLGFTNKLLHLMTHDKKNMNDKINFSLLKEIGEVIYDQTCDVKLIKNAIEYYRKVVSC